MLTPTGVTSAAYWDAIKDGNPTHARITFIGQNIVLEDEDIYLSSGIRVNDILNGETDLVFGRAVSKQVTMTILNTDKLSGLMWTGEFTLEFGVEINGSTEWVTVGIFSGEKPNNVTAVDKIDFTAYDRMKRFDQLADDFVKKLTYPKTVQQIYTALCAYVGLSSVSGNELSNIMSRSYSSAPVEMQGYSCRNILEWIAEACGCYAKITASGNVQMVWFGDQTSYAVTGDEEFSVDSADFNSGMIWDEADTYTWDEFDQFTWNEVSGFEEMYRVDQLMIKQVGIDADINYPSAVGGNVYMIVDNPFLSVGSYTEITTYIAPIYNRLYSFGGYLPVNLECVGNWCVEAGDIITIDVRDETITFPIFVKETRWNSAINDSYTTTGSITRSVYTSDKNRQAVLTNNEIRFSAKRIISEAVDEALDEVGNAYIQKTETLQTADAIVNTATSTAKSYTDTAASTAESNAISTAQSLADAAETNAKNASIAKTTTYQNAAAIVTEAVTQAATSASNNYIAKTTTYQTAASIVTTAEGYTDNKLTSYSTTQQTNTAISQYVTNNAYGIKSGVDITANGIDITGSRHVNVGTSGSGVQITPSGINIDTGGYFKVNAKNLSISEDGSIDAENVTLSGTLQRNGYDVLTKENIIVQTETPSTSLPPGTVWIKPTGSSSTIANHEHNYPVDANRQNLVAHPYSGYLFGTATPASGSSFTYSATAMVFLSANVSNATVTLSLGGGSVVLSTTISGQRYQNVQAVFDSVTSGTWLGNSSSISFTLSSNNYDVNNARTESGGAYKKITLVSAGSGGSSKSWGNCEIRVLQ